MHLLLRPKLSEHINSGVGAAGLRSEAVIPVELETMTPRVSFFEQDANMRNMMLALDKVEED